MKKKIILLKKMFNKVIYSFSYVFSRLKFKYKLTIYFTLFGLFVGHLSFIVYTSVATNNLKKIASVVVEDWFRNNNQPADIIQTYIGQKYSQKMDVIFPFISIFRNDFYADPKNNKFDLYYFSSADNKWYNLSKNDSGLIVQKSVSTEDESQVAEMLKEETLSISHAPFYGRSDNVYFWLNLTRPLDKNIYIARIVSSRKGVLSFIGGEYIVIVYTFALLIISFFLSKAIALHISGPIDKLSSQTGGIASGDLDIRTEILSKDEIGELSQSINKMADRIKENNKNMHERMEAISVMNKIDKAVLSSISRNDLIDRVTFIVSELFNDCIVALAMADPDRKRYNMLSHYIRGIKGNKGKGVILPYVKLGYENVEKNKNFFIAGKSFDENHLNFLNSVIGEQFLHLMNLPIILDEDYIGSLFIGKDVDNPFTEFEIDTLKALADQTGVAMKSVKIFEEKENLFLGILLALSKTIDTKSKWTSGHSERVAAYSEKLAVAMEMDEQFLSELRISANLHDIGKIGVPEAILDKPARLSEAEFDIIKKHPQDGASIIEEIPGYEKFLNGILFHHEAWNGGGYPFGLAGREIPLMGRLIAVADVYDSLISDRPYRSGMSTDDALAILISEKERKLDSSIVDLMIEIIESEKK